MHKGRRTSRQIEPQEFTFRRDPERHARERGVGEGLWRLGRLPRDGERALVIEPGFDRAGLAAFGAIQINLVDQGQLPVECKKPIAGHLSRATCWSPGSVP